MPSASSPSLMVAAALGLLLAGPVRAEPARLELQQRFDRLADVYVDGLARLSPSDATGMGDHRFDDRLTDVSAKSRALRSAFDRKLLGQLKSLPRRRLSRERQVDAALLEQALRYDLWRDGTLEDWSWDLLGYADQASGALSGLSEDSAGPWSRRVRAASRRLEALPRFLAQERATVDVARVPPLVASMASRRNADLLESVAPALVEHVRELPGAERERFRKALASAKGAVAERQRWLDAVVVPNARGDARLGPDLYAQKVRFEIGDMPVADIKSGAQAEVKAIRAQMYAIARTVLVGRDLPAAPTPQQEQAGISDALALTYAHRAARDAVVPAIKADLAAATAFVRRRDLVTVPPRPVQVIDMPKEMQGMVVAYSQNPEPLARQAQSYFAVSPVPGDWPQERTDAYLREYNLYMLQDLVTHEAMPGHYLQTSHARVAPVSRLRRLLASRVFVEGWAVYGEGMMADAGYLDGDPLFRLTVLKSRLRSTVNALIDIGVHAERMSREDAMHLMTYDALQQEPEAALKWTRAQLTSTQLLTYFVGFREHTAMRRAAEARLGSRFDLKAYNDAVLAHGAPPIRFVRELLEGASIH